MKEIMCSGKKIKLDEEGFLVNGADWSKVVAKSLAEQAGIKELSDEQMEIITFIRDYYTKFKAFPILNYVCKNIHQPRECINEQFMNPEIAWKVAGLPKLSGIQFVNIDGKHFHMEECC